MKNALILISSLMLLLLAACQENPNNLKSTIAPNVTNEENNPSAAALHYNQLADSFLKKKDLASAATNIQASITYAKKANNTFLLARGYILYGIIKTQQGDPIGAKENYLSALTIGEQQHLQSILGQAYGGLGITYLTLGEYTTAEENFQKALVIAKENKNLREQLSIYLALLKIYGTVQVDMPKACNTMSAMLHIVDGVQTDDQTRAAFSSKIEAFRNVYNSKCTNLKGPLTK